MGEWQTFVRRFDDLQEGRAELFIKDLTPGPRKYDTKHVIADIARSRETYPEPLWVRSESGAKAPAPWSMRILEVLPEWVEGHPYEDVFNAIVKKQKKERG